MKLFGSYVRQYRNMILLFALFAGIFALVFYLYHIDLQTVVYPTLLCLLAGMLFLLASFLRFRKEHEFLLYLGALSAETISELPEETSLICQDYQTIIRMLQRENIEQAQQSSRDFQDMVEYYAVWAHQIKTPIAAMKLSLQNEDSPQSRNLQSDLLRIEQYVEMVLAYLRLDSESSDFVFKDQAVDSIIREAVKKFSLEFISRKITLQYEPVHKHLVTDDKWLGFVLEQIISNALKYTRSGTIRIFLEGDVLCIEDSGIGIAPEDLPRIFEKGYTGWNGRTDKQASGIGLYLCRRVCKALGIDIKAVSEPGKGTVIRLDLAQQNTRKE